MAITVDAVGTGDGTFSTGNTFAHTVGSSAKMLIVGALVDRPGTLLTGITYNSVVMSSLLSYTDQDTDFYVYYLPNPSSGTHNVVVSYDNGNAKTPAGSVSLFGAATDPPTPFYTASFSTGISYSIGFTSTADIAIDFGTYLGINPIQVNGPNTQVINFQSGGNSISLGGSYTQSSVTAAPGWTQAVGGNDVWIIGGAYILSGGGIPPPPVLHTGTLMLLGTGF